MPLPWSANGLVMCGTRLDLMLEGVPKKKMSLMRKTLASFNCKHSLVWTRLYFRLLSLDWRLYRTNCSSINWSSGRCYSSPACSINKKNLLTTEKQIFRPSTTINQLHEIMFTIPVHKFIQNCNRPGCLAKSQRSGGRRFYMGLKSEILIGGVYNCNLYRVFHL